MTENKQVNLAESDKRDCVKSQQAMDRMSDWTQRVMAADLIGLYAGDQGDENDAHKSGRRIVKLCSVCGGPAHYANSLTWQCSTKGCPAYHATTHATLGVAPRRYVRYCLTCRIYGHTQLTCPTTRPSDAL